MTKLAVLLISLLNAFVVLGQGADKMPELVTGSFLGYTNIVQGEEYHFPGRKCSFGIYDLKLSFTDYVENKNNLSGTILTWKKECSKVIIMTKEGDIWEFIEGFKPFKPVQLRITQTNGNTLTTW